MNLVTQAQIKYESGYYIDTLGVKVNCLIRNADWRENPTYFRWKSNENSSEQRKTIQEVKEFGIAGVVKFLRAEVEVDQSSDVVNDMSYEHDPVNKIKMIFLRVLIEGEASLYSYIDGDSKRYFYSLNNGVIEQLVYKRYITDNVILTNNGFQKQLWDNVRCKNTNISTVQHMKYTEVQLRNYILAYNRCIGKPVMSMYNKSEREVFRVKAIAGINRSSLTVENALFSTRNAAFEPQIGARLGMELEYILPFNKNKWGVLLESSFQYFKGKDVLVNETARINFKSIEFPLGLRYYTYLSKQFQLFFNAHYIPSYSVNFKTMVTYTKTDPLEILPKSSFAFGLGTSMKRLSAELRYYPKRELMGSYLYWSGNYQRISILLGYSIVKIRK